MATPDEKQNFQTYVRRLSHTSEKYPSAFQLRNVKIFDRVSKLCSHSGGGSQKPMEDGYGKVAHARWWKPDRTGVEVAVETLKVSQKLFVVSRLRDLKVFLYRTAIVIRECSSMKLLSGITSTPTMRFHFMVLQLLISRHVLFRCGWTEGVYVATWMRKGIPFV